MAWPFSFWIIRAGYTIPLYYALYLLQESSWSIPRCLLFLSFMTRSLWQLWRIQYMQVGPVAVVAASIVCHSSFLSVPLMRSVYLLKRWREHIITQKYSVFRTEQAARVCCYGTSKSHAKGRFFTIWAVKHDPDPVHLCSFEVKGGSQPQKWCLIKISYQTTGKVRAAKIPPTN